MCVVSKKAGDAGMFARAVKETAIAGKCSQPNAKKWRGLAGAPHWERRCLAGCCDTLASGTGSRFAKKLLLQKTACARPPLVPSSAPFFCNKP
jgi:hypothetical protein